MKTIFKTMFVAAAVLATVACGNSTNKNVEQAAAPVDQLPTVAVAQVNVREVPQTATYTATIQAYVKNNIVPQTAGRITQINVEVGDRVTKGQVLAEIDKVQLQQAQLQLHNAEVELGRLTALYEAGGLSKSDLDAVELQYNVAKTQVQNLIENTTLLSPINGVITARNYDAGDMYAMAAPIFTVEQIAPVKLLVAVSETDYSKVKKGHKVTVKAEAFPEREFTGKVERIYPTIDPSTRTFNVEVVISNGDLALRPGMFARVEVNFGSNNHVVIPDVSVVKQQGSGERFVYVLNEDGTVSYQKVELGRRMGTEYEVISGLKDSSIVVTGGQIRLKDGVKVSVNK
jgi:RND family efflux transporter MFP subunit